VDSNVRRLYRVAERFPPGQREYRSMQEAGKAPPTDASAEMLRSWTAISGWATAELAHSAARRKTSAKWIVRYDIPDDSGILIEESLRPGHFDIFATFDQLHPYLVPDFKEEVVKEG
jgi:hypothetical protein